MRGRKRWQEVVQEMRVCGEEEVDVCGGNVLQRRLRFLRRFSTTEEVFAAMFVCGDN